MRLAAVTILRVSTTASSFVSQRFLDPEPVGGASVAVADWVDEHPEFDGITRRGLDLSVWAEEVAEAEHDFRFTLLDGLDGA